MSGPSRVAVRLPAVAGLFYPAADEQCRIVSQRMLRTNSAVEQFAWIGGVVPHAGWVCSGAIAGEVIGTIARRMTPDLVVIFGAVHTPMPLEFAVLSVSREWRVPGGASEVPADVLVGVRNSSPLFVVDDRFHVREHAVEVELPLIQRAWPQARILPIEVPLLDEAIEIGERTARVVSASEAKVVYLASSDLTHYGPAYHFVPAGVGLDALTWAKENDRRLLETIESFSIDRIVPEVRTRMNACGGGAIAAMLAACRLSGATRATLLRHANSYETLQAVAPQRPDNAVGYAAVVVG